MACALENPKRRFEVRNVLTAKITDSDAERGLFLTMGIEQGWFKDQIPRSIQGAESSSLPHLEVDDRVNDDSRLCSPKLYHPDRVRR